MTNYLVKPAKYIQIKEYCWTLIAQKYKED